VKGKFIFLSLMPGLLIPPDAVHGKRRLTNRPGKPVNPDRHGEFKIRPRDIPDRGNT
jgi:hypothetical protein